MFGKKDIKKAEEMGLLTPSPEPVRIVVPNKRDILQSLWNELLDHTFTITSHNDGRPISVIRADDIYAIMNKKLDEGEKPIKEW